MGELLLKSVKRIELLRWQTNVSPRNGSSQKLLVGPVAIAPNGTGLLFLGRKPVICSMDEDVFWEAKEWLEANCEVVWVGAKRYQE